MARQIWRESEKNQLEFYVDEISSDDVTIVIPTLNEETAIAKVIDEIYIQGYENVLIVDGYSNDRTVEIAKSLKAKIIYQEGTGKTGAIKTAIQSIQTPFIIIIDGDNTYPPENIDNVLQYLRYFEQVIGARSNGRSNITSLNRFGNYVINKMFNLFFGTDFTDVCSGLYGLRTNFAEEIHLDTKGFDVEVEIASQSANKGSIFEVPIGYRKRLGVQKLAPFRDGYYIMKSLLGLGVKYSPIIFFSTMFSLLMIPALLVLGYTAIEWYARVWHEGLALLGILMTIIGFQSLMITVFSVQQKKTVHELTKRIAKLRFLKKER